MSVHEDKVYLRHILDAIERIERYVQGVEQAEFEAEELLQDGVIRQLEIIGEAAKRVSSDLKALYSEVPWRDIVDMRKRLFWGRRGISVDDSEAGCACAEAGGMSNVEGYGRANPLLTPRAADTASPCANRGGFKPKNFRPPSCWTNTPCR